MNQIDTGRFIASCRKEKGLTGRYPRGKEIKREVSGKRRFYPSMG